MNGGSDVTPVGRRSQRRPSKLYPVLWRFAAERQRIYLLRVAGEIGPWTDDPCAVDVPLHERLPRLRPGQPVLDPAGVLGFLRE